MDELQISQNQLKKVDVQEIEQELMHFWQKTVEEHGEEDIPAVMKACMLNLLIHTSRQKVAQRVSQIIAEIIKRYPCRAFVMDVDLESTSDLLEAWVSIQCQLSSTDNMQVCCEQISILARGQAIEKLHSLIASLLIADLPVVLWWFGDASWESDLFGRLADISDRVIVDSSGFLTPKATLSKLATLVKNKYPQLFFSDLNWGRLTPWRKLIVQFFDAPNFHPYLFQLNKVVIEYAQNERESLAHSNQAFLLAGWLATRLGWQFEGSLEKTGERNYLFSMSKSGNPITIEIRAGDFQDDVPSGIISINLKATDDEASAEFTISKSEDGACALVTTKVEGASQMTRNVQMKPLSESQLLVGELDIHHRDWVFEEALEMASEWIDD